MSDDMRKPITIHIPATLEQGACRLFGPVVEQLPPSAVIGDLVTYENGLYCWNGEKWVVLVVEDSADESLTVIQTGVSES